jgi:integrase
MASRIYKAHKMHFRKKKWYASVSVPPEVRHLHSEPRLRLSTGTSDKTTAGILARDKVVPLIHRRIDALFDKLDPFVEGLRDILENEGADVSQWYHDGCIKLKVSGDKTTLSATSGGIKFKANGRALTVVEQWKATNYKDLAMMVTSLGYAVPERLLTALPRDLMQEIYDTAKPTGAPPSVMGKLYKEITGLLGDEDGQRALQMMPSTITRINIQSAKTLMPMFIDWSERYIKEKKRKDSIDVHTKRKKACAMFFLVCGNKPLDEYDAVHMIEMARYMDHDTNGRQWAKATIKNYVSYVKQAFDYAGSSRNDLGKVVLTAHPFHNMQEIKSYGSEGKPYLPLTNEELTSLFSSKMEPQERLLLAVLVTTGMRLDEAALMIWERITLQNGVLCFSLVDHVADEAVRVKNVGSRRYIPVPDVIKSMLGNGGTGRLFNYRIDTEGKSENAASKSLMPIIRQVTSHPQKAVHSLRGTFIDLVRELGDVDSEDRKFITGHKQGDVGGDGYGEGPSMKKRLNIINKVEHPWLTSAFANSPHKAYVTQPLPTL